MRKILLLCALLSLVSCQSSDEGTAGFEADSIVVLTRRLERIEKQLKIEIPEEEKIHIFDVRTNEGAEIAKQIQQQK